MIPESSIPTNEEMIQILESLNENSEDKPMEENEQITLAAINTLWRKDKIFREFMTEFLRFLLSCKMSNDGPIVLEKTMNAISIANLMFKLEIMSKLQEQKENAH